MTDAPVATPIPARPAEDPASLMAMLRTKRKRQAMQRRRVFDLPGYDGLVGVRLNTVDERGVIDDTAVMVDGEDPSEMDAGVLFDARRMTIVRACVEIVVRGADTDQWTKLEHVLGDGHGPVRFDERLCKFLREDDDDPIPTIEDGAVGVLKWACSQALPFMGFYALYAEWCSLDSPLEMDELVGESFAAS